MNLKKRGSAQKLEDLYTPALDEQESYAFNIKNAGEMIKEAVQAGRPVTIIGDYDVDGITASAIMYTMFTLLGTRARVRLPLRFAEGYGMKVSMIDEVPENSLLITVDNGITAHEAVRAARAKGIRVIVTDHHLPDMEDGCPVLPEADCVIDPHIEEITGAPGYDYHSYCGAGVALMIAEQLLGKDFEGLDALYGYAAVATVADIMPLTGHNRVILKRGIRAIKEHRVSEGLYQICSRQLKLGEQPDDLDPLAAISGTDISFYLAPALNAPSRIIEHTVDRFSYVLDGGDGAKVSYVALTAGKKNSAMMTEVLAEYNQQRKEEADRGYELVKKVIREKQLENDEVLVVHVPDLRPGMIGIYAGRLETEYRVPAIVICGSGECHGSCRSPENVNIRDVLSQAADLLTAFGGHAGAAGLSVPEENIPALSRRLNTVCFGTRGEDIDKDTLFYDLEIDASQLQAAQDYMVQYLMPFGEANPEPVFLIRGFDVTNIRALGSKTLRLDTYGLSAIRFQVNAEELAKRFHPGQSVDLVGRVGLNCFRGVAKLQVTVDGYVGPDGEVF